MPGDSSTTSVLGLYESPRIATEPPPSGSRSVTVSASLVIPSRFAASVASATMRWSVERPRERGERHVVAREAGAAVADGTAQVLRADAAVQSERRGDVVDVRARQALTDAREHVREGDLRRDEGVDGDLRQFRVHEVEARDGWVVVHDPADRCRRARCPERSSDSPISRKSGCRKSLDDAAERDELRAVAEPDVHADALSARLFERLPDRARRSRPASPCSSARRGGSRSSPRSLVRSPRSPGVRTRARSRRPRRSASGRSRTSRRWLATASSISVVAVRHARPSATISARPGSNTGGRPSLIASTTASLTIDADRS